MFCKKESHLIPTFVAKYMNNDKRIARNGSLLTVLKFFMHLILQLSILNDTFKKELKSFKF